MSSGTLFIVATPIGNLQDITFRAIETLKNSSLIIAEDTRETGKLLSHFGIKVEMTSSHKFSEKQKVDNIISRLEKGENLSLVSDAGTPLISDPGFVAVKECIARGIDVKSIPGPSSVLSALVVSGFDVSRFVFIGFIAKKKNDRIRDIEMIRDMKLPVVIFESPKRVKETLEMIGEIIKGVRVSVSKEITKIHEAAFRGSVNEVLEMLDDSVLKGEFVVVIGDERETASVLDDAGILEMVDVLIEQGVSRSEAVKEISGKTGISKNRIYNIVHGTKED